MWRKIMVFGLVLVAGPAWAQDASNDRPLTAAGRQVDQSATGSDQGRVTSRIVEQWKGTEFTFEKGAAARELTAQDVQDYRAKGLGYGEISILLALAAKQDSQTPLAVSEIHAMRTTDGMGWGNIAKELGYTSLGSVVSSVKKTDQTLRADRAQRVDRTGKGGKPDSTARIEKAERPGRPEKIERVEKVERVERVERPQRPERPEKPEKGR